MHPDIETTDQSGQGTGIGERTATARMAEKTATAAGTVAQTGDGTERTRQSQEVSSVSVGHSSN